MIITPHIQIIYYIQKGWRIGNTYIVCFSFVSQKKKTKEIYISEMSTFMKKQRFQPSWFNMLPSALLICIRLSWFILKTRKTILLILRIFLWCECETLCITLSYPIISLQVSPLNTAIVSKCSKCHLRRINFAKFPGWVYPRSPLEAHT